MDIIKILSLMAGISLLIAGATNILSHFKVKARE